MFAQRTIFESYNQKLAQARDLLLPRLMNGEIRYDFRGQLRNGTYFH